MDLNEISVFLKVVQSGSFTKAAAQLSMPISTVSSRISSLETRLGVTLLTRTTRRLSVTAAGRAYFDRCVRGLEEIKTAEEEITSIQNEPHGLLRVTAPVELGSVVLPPIVAAYIKKFPKVILDFVLSDRRVDLVADGVDLAIRAGELPSSSLKAKRLGDAYFALFASRSYLKAHGTPEVPKDLISHCCLHFSALGEEGWRLSSPRSSQTVRIEKKISMSDVNGIKAMAVAGLGIALLPMFLCQQEVRQEKLVPLLPEWKTNLRPVHFVYASDRFTSPKIRSFVDVATPFLQNVLKPQK